MKLRRRRSRTDIACSAIPQPARGQSLCSTSSLHHSRPPLPPPSPTTPHPPPQLTLRHGSGEQCPPAISSPAVPLLPSFFIKLLKQQNVERRTVAAPTLPTQLSYSTITGRASSSPPSLLLHPIGWPRRLSGPNGTLSVAGGAIGKQSMKMNYPVLFPSLTNK